MERSIYSLAVNNGSIVSSHVARHLNKRFAITLGKGMDTQFHRMHVPEKGLRVCLIDDLIFSGTEVKDHIQFFEREGLKLLGISVWVNRQESVIDGINVASLMKPKFSQYEKSNCPFCKQNVPIEFSGVRE